MRVPPTIADPRGWALFLDFDGTLVDIAPSPCAVVVPDDLVALLQRLTDMLDGAVAIISGRRIHDLDRLLSPLKAVAAGVYGAELRLQPTGPIETTEALLPAAVIRDVMEFAARLDGVLVEDKGTAVAVHYRHAPARQAAIETGLLRIVDRDRQSLSLSRGRMVYEVGPSGATKGRALETLARLPQFSGRQAVMIGDDAPDMSALAMAARLGGRAYVVAGEYFPVQTAHFAAPARVRAWLRRCAEIG